MRKDGSSQSRARNPVRPDAGLVPSEARESRRLPSTHRTRAWVESPRAAPPLPLPGRPAAPGAPPANPGPAGLLLGLGLALACLGLLLAAVSLGSRASPPAQEPSQGELVAEEDPDPPELHPQAEESQDPGPFLKRLVRPRRTAAKGQKPRARRAVAAHYEVHPRPGQDRAQAGMDGTVRGWEEAKINSSNPLRYDRQSGEFLVVRAGLYYLYCQVSPTWPHGTAGMGARGAGAS
ncbi:tumor necrosis factor ligand superfamily member 12-like [Ailuropoda melanoleuca]|uniref:tumor necrosis factor ligand superfamily member 12-like n=1 Tax=Ailuropoda melanoleuca TaxID=9646 RepID=UPI0014947341|nr:tumor necrosis factor ligand superfamily member 12-like [Ailuropoda melanoleuca]